MSLVASFEQLSDLDFEEVVADLLQAETGLRFTAGIRGADAGVDVHAIDASGGQHVAQCKHYLASSVSKVRTAARKEATEWQRRAKPASYRFITSRRLTHANRQELTEILTGLVASSDDVLGAMQLQELIRHHSDVEARHVKLWLGGAGQLRRLLNSGVYERSSALVDEIRGLMPRYVETERYLDARRMLQAERVCVIAGPAGVGKTTIARLLLIDALETGFQPYEIPQQGIKEAWELVRDDEKQLFYYDDFLGRIGPYEATEDQELLVRLMRRAAARKNMRFVLTTREYILQQAHRVSELLEREESDVHRFLLRLEDYTRQERARILYNHVYFSPQVNAIARRALLKDRVYLRIIDHRNYNPRLIEWMTGLAGPRLSPGQQRDFGRHCLQVLKDPSALWTKAFGHLEPQEQALLLALASLSEPVYERILEPAYAASCGARDTSTLGHGLQQAIGVLDDSFIRTRRDEHGLSVGFLNPSLLDFVIKHLEQSRADAVAAIEGAHYFDQVVWLWSALSSEDDQPRADLLPSFASAFGRTFDRVASDQRYDVFSSEPYYRHYKLTDREERLELLLDRCQESTMLTNLVRPHLKDRASAWLTELTEASWLPTSSFPLIRRLIAMHALELGATVQALKPAVVSTRSESHRWNLITAMATLGPKVFEPSELASERDALAAYLESVLEDPLGYVEEVSELEDLGVAADMLGVEYSQDAYDDAWGAVEQWVEENKDPPEYEPDYDGDDLRSLRGGSDEDRSIDAMFGRLADD